MNASDMKESAEPIASDEQVLAAVTKMLEARSEIMSSALKHDHRRQLSESKHLDEGSVESGYWHAGYVDALRDVLSMIRERPDSYPMKLDPTKL